MSIIDSGLGINPIYFIGSKATNLNVKIVSLRNLFHDLAKAFIISKRLRNNDCRIVLAKATLFTDNDKGFIENGFQL